MKKEKIEKPIRHGIKYQRVVELLEASDNTALTVDGHDSAILGLCWASGAPRVVYSVQTILNDLVKQGMSPNEAREFYEFNIEGAYVGEQTPLFVEIV